RLRLPVRPVGQSLLVGQVGIGSIPIMLAVVVPRVGSLGPRLGPHAGEETVELGIDLLGGQRVRALLDVHGVVVLDDALGVVAAHGFLARRVGLVSVHRGASWLGVGVIFGLGGGELRGQSGRIVAGVC